MTEETKKIEAWSWPTGASAEVHPGVRFKVLVQYSMPDTTDTPAPVGVFTYAWEFTMSVEDRELSNNLFGTILEEARSRVMKRHGWPSGDIFSFAMSYQRL